MEAAYGEIRGRFGPNGFSVAYGSDTRFEFTGYETDFAGLEYAGARFFDPELTQFASHDPAGQFASPYAYGPGDPINTTDPTGMLAETGVDAAVSIDYSSALSSLVSVAWSASIQALVQSGSVRAEARAFDRSAAKGLSQGYGLVEPAQSHRAGLDLENYAMDIVTAPFGTSTIGATIVVLALTENWKTVSGSDSPSSQRQPSPSEVAAAEIFRNREVPRDIIDQIPRRELDALAELRVIIAELRQQPGAPQVRDELRLSRSMIKLGSVEIAASMSSSVVGVLNPSRTAAQIARDLPGVLQGPEGALARQGAGRFTEGLEGIKEIVRQPIGPPIW